jgi:hypothetical protein
MIQPTKSSPIPRTAMVELGPAFVELKNSDGLDLNILPFIGIFIDKSAFLSNLGSNSCTSPVNFPVIVSILVLEKLGEAARNHDNTLNNNLTKIRSVRGNEPVLKPFLTNTNLSLTDNGKIQGIP